MQDQETITQCLLAWRQGDESAREELFDTAYEQMRQIARSILHGDRMRFSLQPTELVNECALRMFGLAEMDWRDRAHFIAMAATTMRRILIDEARRKQANKRDGEMVTLLTFHGQPSGQDVDLEALDEALTRLHDVSEDFARVVELKYFGGLTNEEVAEVMGTSDSTVKRTWRSARAWLYAELDHTP